MVLNSKQLAGLSVILFAAGLESPMSASHVSDEFIDGPSPGGTIFEGNSRTITARIVAHSVSPDPHWEDGSFTWSASGAPVTFSSSAQTITHSCCSATRTFPRTFTFRENGTVTLSYSGTSTVVNNGHGDTRSGNALFASRMFYV